MRVRRGAVVRARDVTLTLGEVPPCKKEKKAPEDTTLVMRALFGKGNRTQPDERNDPFKCAVCQSATDLEVIERQAIADFKIVGVSICQVSPWN